MTKKDFELIAGVLRRADTCTAKIVDAREVALMFADALQHTNPRFDRERFIAAATGRDA